MGPAHPVTPVTELSKHRNDRLGRMTERQRKPAAERKAEIVATAIELAGQLGPVHLSTQRLADEIGISQAAIFRHFPTKAHIWLAVAENIRAFMDNNATRMQDQGATGTTALETMVTGHLGFIQHTPAIPAILFSQELHAENDELRAVFGELITQNHRMFSQAIGRGIAKGQFRHDLDADTAAYLVLSLIQGLAMRWSIANREFDLPTEGRRLLKLLCQGFVASP